MVFIHLLIFTMPIRSTSLTNVIVFLVAVIYFGKQ